MVLAGFFFSVFFESMPLLMSCSAMWKMDGSGIADPGTGGNIAANLASWGNLRIFSGDGCDPAEAARLIEQAVTFVREARRPAMLRLTVPRLQGHSFQDTQAYKSEDVVRSEWQRDPLPRLKEFLVPAVMTEEEWAAARSDAHRAAENAREAAEARPVADPATVTRNVFFSGEMEV